MASSISTNMPVSNGWLPDANVWLALCSDRHEHHQVAADWFSAAHELIWFCRVTQMTLLRLLTNKIVMGTDLLRPGEAIDVYRRLLNDSRIRFADEPVGAEGEWLALMEVPEANGSVWTDAWLAAFSIVHGSRLISFDAGTRRWTTASVEVLRKTGSL